MAAFRDNDVMDKKINVNRERLLASIKANRANHAASYETAVKGWEIEYDEAVEAYGNEVRDWVEKDSKPEEHHKLAIPRFNPPARPQHHLKDYDLMVAALELCPDETVEMTLGEIDKYERDNWEWQEHFKAITQTYTAKFNGAR